LQQVATKLFSIAGQRWEVYGHWSDNAATRRTDIFYLLKEDAAS
jgi:hypothetical protein